MSDQDQRVGIGATAVQVGRDVIIYDGPTVEQMRMVAQDVFNAGFRELTSVARDVATARAHEVTDRFLDRLKNDNPDALRGVATDPGFQAVLFNVQKDYARTGDEDLSDVLVDLLIDRSKQPARDIMQIVLDESIVTAPKLTVQQINALSIVFVLVHAKFTSIDSWGTFGNTLSEYVGPLVGLIPVTSASYRHLAFAGCATYSFGGGGLVEKFMRSYRGLMYAGFDKEALPLDDFNLYVRSRVICPCINDASLFQVAALNEAILEEKLAESGLSEEHRAVIKRMAGQGLLSSERALEKLIECAPFMKDLNDLWERLGMSALQLTSVGMAIGHANLKKGRGSFADLTIWIN